MKQKLEIENINSITVLNLIQIQNPDVSEYLLIVYPKLKDFRSIIIQYDKNIYFGNFFFHWLEIKQIEKNFIQISKFEMSIEKTKKKLDKKSHLSH